MKSFFALVLIALAASPALSQEIDCTEEFFRVSRRADSCQGFFICMIGGRVNFDCDDGDIFDEDLVTCRAGDADTCEYVNNESSTVTGTVAPPAFAQRLDSVTFDEKFSKQIEIIGDECENNFLLVAPHPNPELCAHFFICMNYNLVQFECDYGFIFSSTQERCVVGSPLTCEEDDLVPFKKAMKLIRKLSKKLM